MIHDTSQHPYLVLVLTVLCYYISWSNKMMLKVYVPFRKHFPKSKLSAVDCLYLRDQIFVETFYSYEIWDMPLLIHSLVQLLCAGVSVIIKRETGSQRLMSLFYLQICAIYQEELMLSNWCSCTNLHSETQSKACLRWAVKLC